MIKYEIVIRKCIINISDSKDTLKKIITKDVFVSTDVLLADVLLAKTESG